MPVQFLRRSFTVEDYHRMAQAGIFSEDDRVELLKGEIVTMAPIGSRHQACVDRLTGVLSLQVARRAIVRVQGPVRLDEHSEPQPDVALLKNQVDYYAQRHPRPEDVLLVIEVAETSAEADRDIKVPLYARAGIPEAWLVDLSGECIEIFQEPSPQGYQEVRRVRRGHRLAPRAFPDLDLAAHDLLG